MLDHVFTDAIGALRDALEAALLQRSSPDEHFQLDVVTGDTTWETSYGLPGEHTPARVRADISLDWPTWSQSAFRSWLQAEEPDDEPHIDIGVVLRIQGLVAPPDPAVVTGALPTRSAPIGDDALERTTPTVETSYSGNLVATGHAIEIGFDGTYELDDKTLTDGSLLDDHFSAMGVWIASMLVTLGDLPLEYTP